MRNDTTTITATPGAPTAAPAARPLIKTGIAPTAIALAGVTVTYLLSQATGTELLVASGGDANTEVALRTVLGMSVAGAGLAVALAWAFGRWAPRPRMTFLTTTLVGLAAYAAVPFAAAESVGTAVWLNGFHLAVAIPVLTVLGRRLPTGQSRGRA